MSLEVWGDESPGATRGSETLLFEDMMRIRAKFDLWLSDAIKRNEFWCPEDQELAEKISGDLDTLRERMDVKL